MGILPKTIQIFLPDGNARSIRIAEITSRTVQAIQIPRSKVSDSSQRKEVKGVGIYFLFGEGEETTKPSVYIGEAEDCFNRLRQQNQAKEFWSTAVVVTSKTNSFTKAHVKFLEWHCYDVARTVDRYSLENSTVPTKPYISEPVEADLMDNFETIRVLLSTLGFPILELVEAARSKRHLFYCRGKHAIATGDFIEDGFLVFKGSTCRKELSKSAGVSVRNIRKRLLAEDVLELNDLVYTLKKDYLFSSPSAAAGAVLSRNANGWTQWKNKDGQTLDELKRK